MQNRAICAATRHAVASSAQSAARAGLTVTPQLPQRAFSSVCSGLPFAFLQALDQKEAEDMMRRLRGEKVVAKMPQLCAGGGGV
jgi:hypothetical protein